MTPGSARRANHVDAAPAGPHPQGARVQDRGGGARGDRARVERDSGVVQEPRRGAIRPEKRREADVHAHARTRDALRADGVRAIDGEERVPGETDRVPGADAAAGRGPGGDDAGDE